MKKSIISLLACLLLLLPTNSVIHAMEYSESAQHENAQGVVLINLNTNTVVYEDHANTQYIPASLTKVMTFIVATELESDLDRKLTAPLSVFNELVAYNASNAGFIVDEEISVRDLLYGLILPSGCDAAAILATTLTNHNTDEFIDLMNAKAKEIGATNTHFGDVHGLDNTNSYTTAQDMALITQHAMENPLFMEIASTTTYDLSATNLQQARTIVHTNSMLFSGSIHYNPLVSGIKTGTTGNYDKNLVTVASKDGVDYLLVLLASPSVNSAGQPVEGTYDDTTALYDWAFTNLGLHTLLEQEETIQEVDIQFGEGSDTIIGVAKDHLEIILNNEVDLTQITPKVTMEEQLTAPIEKGTTIGSIQYTYNEEVIATMDIVASQTIQKSMFKMVIHYGGMALVWLVGLAVIFVFVLLGLRQYNKRNRYRSKKYSRRGRRW